MRLLLIVFLFCVPALGRAETVMDFDSPFAKSAIIHNTLGQQETREVLGAEKKGNKIELRKADGTLVVVAEDKVVAIIPKLPSSRSKYTREEAAKAYLLLQKAQPQLLNREEVGPVAMKAWEKLAHQESNYEVEAKKARAAMVQNWFSKVSLEGDQEKNVTLEEYIREGEVFLVQAGEEREAVQKRLDKARQRMAMDFSRLEKLHLVADWANVTPLLPLGLIGVLGLLSVWGFLNISNFLTALKMTVMSLLSSERSSRALVISLKSLVGIILGPLLFYVVYLSTRVEKTPAEQEIAELSMVAKRALYLSLNSHFNWSNQSAQKVEVSSSEMLRFLFSKIENPDVTSGGYVQFGTPVFRLEPERLRWVQGMKLLWFPLQMEFLLPIGSGTFSLFNSATLGFSLGKLPLGAFIGEYVAAEIMPAFKEWNGQIGIDSKAEWRWKDKNQLVISTPDVMLKKMGSSISEGKKSSGGDLKKNVTAGELARIFADGSGNEYLGKYVDVSGQIAEVSSGHRLGNSLASEVLRKTLAGKGGAEAVAKIAPKGVEDQPDLFFLSTEDEVASKIRIKCVVKAPEAFYLDGHGDLYREGQNPGTDDPLVRKGTEAHFKGGRIESFDRGVVEVYDAKIVEIAGDSTSGKETKPVGD